jgi:hypothetical protein
MYFGLPLRHSQVNHAKVNLLVTSSLSASVHNVWYKLHVDITDLQLCFDLLGIIKSFHYTGCFK